MPRLSNKWADAHIATLQRGESVTINPVGGSMEPLIASGDRVTLSPYERKPWPNDIVLVRVNNFVYVHKIVQVAYSRPLQPAMYLIGNNKGKLNGWVPIQNIYGVVTDIQRERRHGVK